MGMHAGCGHGMIMATSTAHLHMQVTTAPAGMCPTAGGAGGGQVGMAWSPITRGGCGSCFTCTSGSAHGWL